MVVQIQVRRDTAANWTSNDPTMAAGEFGFETDTKRLKIGDGSTAWTALAYLPDSTEAVEDLVGDMVTGNTETFITVTYQDADGTIDFVVPVIDDDTMAAATATNLATSESIKAYADNVGGGDVFKTITGITNDVVADATDDTLTLSSANNKLTIVGTTATDTITFTLVEGNIDHDALTNFVAAEHKLEAAIDHDALTNFDANEHKLEAAIDHDALTNFAANEHVVLPNTMANVINDMIDDDTFGTASAVIPASSESIKAYVDASGGGDAFKTITGITNDVVADSSTDTLTLASTDAKLTIVGTAATDTITFSIIEGQIDHDALTNFDANEHKLEAAIDHDALTNFAANEHVVLPNTMANVINDMIDDDTFGTASAVIPASSESIKAYVDAYTMIGSGNAQYVGCSMDLVYPTLACNTVGTTLRNLDGTDFVMRWQLFMPTSLGSLKLYVAGIRVEVWDADASDYLDFVDCYKMRDDSGVRVVFDDTNRTAQGTYDTDIDPDVAIDDYTHFIAAASIVCATASDFDITAISVLCYYAA